MTESISFPLFVVMWNQQQRQSTPGLHLKIARWLEARYTKTETRLLLMAFRSAGKSTIVGLFCAWLLYIKPELRIMVIAADMLLARKMVRNVKRIIERHTLTPHLKPDAPDQWGTDRFTIKRELELRDPSMLARGLNANFTGSRADIVICDDVEVPNTADSADKREELRAKLMEIDYVLASGGTQLYVGTPHSFDTIYTTKQRAELPDSAPFLRSFKTLKIPIHNQHGVSSWPERFSNEDIERLKIHTGPNRFRSQMMLEPVNITQGRLEWQSLQRYSHTLEMAKELGSLYLGDRELVSGSSWWDPAFGSTQGDGSVFAAAFTDKNGQIYLHKVEYIKTTKASPEDEATQQCKIVASLIKALYLPSVAIEINGIGRFLPAILRRELMALRVPASVLEVSSRKAKDIRILEAFDAPLAGRILHAHETVFSSRFFNEMQDWRPGANTSDDGLDAVAGAISLEPVRLSGGRIAGGPIWRKGMQPSRAITDFKI